MTSALYPNTYVFRAFAQGATVPLAGGLLYFYAAGTSTPQAAYTDTTGSTPCANPLVLDANGVASFCLLSGLSYKINLTDANGVTQDGWPKDNILSDDGLSAVVALLAGNTGAAQIGYLAPYTGAVPVTQSVLNGPTVTPEEFGAIAGTGVSGAIRTANVIALNKAITAIMGNGTLLIRDTYETNAPLILGSTITQYQTRTTIMGNGDNRSAIIGYGSGAVLDGTGARWFTIQGVRVYSTTAECGLLVARNSQSQDCQSWVLNQVNINGYYSKAPLITIAAEVLRATDCQFTNATANAYSYMTSVNNTLIAATTTMGPITASTNTDVKFWGCTFSGEYALAGAGHGGMWFDTNFEGVFDNCQITSQGPSGPGINTNLVRLKAVSGSFFGKLVFSECHFEITTTGAATANVFYFDFTATATNFQSVEVLNSHMALTGNVTVNYWTNITFATATFCSWINNTNQAGLQLDLPATLNCRIDALQFPVKFWGIASNSLVRAKSVAWGTNMYAASSLIADRTLLTNSYGVSPNVPPGTNIPATFNDTAVERLILGPLSYNRVLPFRGEIQTWDSAYSYVHAISGVDAMTRFDGKAHRPIGAYPGTPATGGASGVAGTTMYDASFFYICTASGTAATALGAMTGTIAAGSQTLTVSGGTLANFDTGNAVLASCIGCFITVATLNGGEPQQIINRVGSVLTLARPNTGATVTSQAVAWAVPVWRRAAIATW